MRRAGSAATEHGSNRKFRKGNSKPKPTKSNASAQAGEHRFLAIYAGRELLGWVGQYGKVFTATSAPDHAPIGDFTSLKAAADAVGAATRAANLPLETGSLSEPVADAAESAL